MAKTKTLAQIRTSVQTEGGYERSADITTTVLNDYINKAIVRGREIITAAWRDYYTIGATTPLVSGTSSYSLPADFEHLRKVELAANAGLTKWRKLYPADLSGSTNFQYEYRRKYRYRLQGGATPLVLMPMPSSSTETIRVWYIPYATELVSDSDSVTILLDVEFELYVLLALKKCRKREDLDARDIDADIQECVMRLKAAAENRDASEPFYLSDRRGYDDDCEEPW